MSALINKSSAKILVIAGLAIGLSAIGLAQSTSVVKTINNQNAINNTTTTPENLHAGTTGGGHNTSGGTGGHSSGGDGGHGGGPNCVPEPVSMLALGVGSGLVFLKLRKKA